MKTLPSAVAGSARLVVAGFARIQPQYPKPNSGESGYNRRVSGYNRRLSGSGPTPLSHVGALAALLTLAFVCSGTAQESDAKITYDDHVKPVFREHCLACHNQDQAKGGLALDTFARTIEGGAGGEVVFEEDLDSSRLWALVNHDDEPAMPPSADKLADAKLDLIRRWIEGGLLENAGSSAKKKPTLDPAASMTTVAKGEVIMPEGLFREPAVFSSRAAAASAVACSPFSPLAAVAGQRQIVLYHTDNGQLLGVLPFPEGVPQSLRFSRNGALLVAGGGRGAHLGVAAVYEVRTGKRAMTVGEEIDAVLSADINESHTLVALGGPKRVVRVYATATGELAYEIRKHTEWIFAVQFSPDGVLLATADRNGAVMVWEADTGREYLDLQGHTAAVTAMSWRDDSNVLATASEDGTVRLWELNDGKQIRSISAHGGGVQDVCFAHNGQLVSVGRDRTAKVWDAAGKQLAAMPAMDDIALVAAFTHDDARVVAGDWTGRIRLFDVASAQQVALLPANPPTLAMRAEAATAQAAAAQAAADAAAAAVQQAEQALAKHDATIASLAEQMAALKSQHDQAVEQKAQTEKELAAKRSEAEKAATAAAPVAEAAKQAQAELQALQQADERK